MALRIGRPYAYDGYPPMTDDDPYSGTLRQQYGQSFMPPSPSGTRMDGVNVGGTGYMEPPPVDLAARYAASGMGRDGGSPPPVPIESFNQGREAASAGNEDWFRQYLAEQNAPPSRPMYGNRSRPEQQIKIKFAQNQPPEVMRAFHGERPEDIDWHAPGTSSPEEDDFRRDMAAYNAPPPAPQGASSQPEYAAQVGDYNRRRDQAHGRRDQHLFEAEQSGNREVADFLSGGGSGASGRSGARGRSGRTPLQDFSDYTLSQQRIHNMEKPPKEVLSEEYRNKKKLLFSEREKLFRDQTNLHKQLEKVQDSELRAGIQKSIEDLDRELQQNEHAIQNLTDNSELSDEQLVQRAMDRGMSPDRARAVVRTYREGQAGHGDRD